MKISVIELKCEPVVKCEDTKPQFGVTLLTISYTFLMTCPACENLWGFFVHFNFLILL